MTARFRIVAGLGSVFLFTALDACGGGSSSGGGILIEGTLVEARSTGHASAKHSRGQPIEDVVVCALERCSVTDGEGRWGFVAPESFAGGAVEFTADGHGIKAGTALELPSSGDVFVELLHVDGGRIAGRVSAAEER